jgi:hypothetical protein
VRSSRNKTCSLTANLDNTVVFIIINQYLDYNVKILDSFPLPVATCGSRPEFFLNLHQVRPIG